MTLACYRYITKALKGTWRSTEEEALQEALRLGQASQQDGTILLHDFARLETQPDLLCEAECSRLPR